ncbi:hypothetical protein CU097_007166 [Rhizopus azygosporus]|uniref:Mid2 domain-containing protein n=1 Tax=Rhizopus azygosporus TaxID=86630 RepID=A0A367JPB8_RHIAZ|nr:hypothetical protein CU097_007166 [Rhizopus azygosporus]
MLLLVTLVIILAPSIYAQTKTATATSSSVSAKPTGNNYTMKKYVDDAYLLVMCGSNGNTDTICSPKPNDTWKNGTWYPITWNSMYPSYVSAETLDIYVYFIQNYQKIQVKHWSDIDPSVGTFPILVDNSWRLDSGNQTYDCLVYIIPSHVKPLKEMNNVFSDYPSPIHINLAQVALASSSVSLSATQLGTAASRSVAIVTPTIQASVTPSAVLNKDQHALQPWVISAASLAILAAIGACITLCWAMRHVRRKLLVHGEKDQLESSNSKSAEGKESFFNNNASSMTMVNPTIASVISHSQPTKLHETSKCEPSSPLYEMRPHSSVSLYSKEPLLSSTDALMIADTFRQRMRCPEWQQLQLQRQSVSEEEQDREEERRRQLGEELLKKELEAEGTLMKKVGKRLANTYQP